MTIESASDLGRIAVGVELVCMALVLGATVFFFFVQSPQLMTFLGREKFVPIQMKITTWFFSFIQIPLVIVGILSFLRGGIWTIATSFMALFGGSVNYFFIVPQVISSNDDGIHDKICYFV